MTQREVLTAKMYNSIDLGERFECPSLVLRWSTGKSPRQSDELGERRYLIAVVSRIQIRVQIRPSPWRTLPLRPEAR